MGRLIDADKFEAFVIHTNGDEEFVNGVQYVLEKIDNAPTVEAIPKDQYEARLKADMVAMLTEIQTEIDEIELDLPFGFEPATKTEAFYQGVSASEKVIQEKIEKLKESRFADNPETLDNGAKRRTQKGT